MQSLALCVDSGRNICRFEERQVGNVRPLLIGKRKTWEVGSAGNAMKLIGGGGEKKQEFAGCLVTFLHRAFFFFFFSK